MAGENRALEGFSVTLARIDERVNSLIEKLDIFLLRMDRQDIRVNDLNTRGTRGEEQAKDFSWLKRLLFGVAFFLVIALGLAFWALVQTMP